MAEPKAPYPVATRSTLVAWWWFGVFLAVGLVAFVVPFVNRLLDSPLVTHGVVAVLALAWFALPACVIRLRNANGNVLSPGVIARVRAVCWSGTLILLALLVWSLVVIQRSMAEAESASLGQPYCVEVAGKMGPHPARSYWDLSGFFIHANNQSMRHARLAAGNPTDTRLYYWSYGAGRFVPEKRGEVLQCKRQSQSVRQLTWLPRDTTPSTATEFGLGGGQWRIPLAHMGGGSYRPPELHFLASGSQFDPPGGPLVAYGPQSWEQVSHSVTVSLCKPTRLHGWQQTTDETHAVKTIGSAFGLEKQTIRYLVDGRVDVQYVQRNIDGQLTTWMKCGVGEFWKYCEHAFVRQGMVVLFTHPQSDFAQWQAMENALWVRVKSFAVVWPVDPPPVCGGEYG